MPNENAASDDKEATAVDRATREQIDLLFATLVDGMDRESNGLKTEAMVEIVVTLWRSARRLEEDGHYSPKGTTVEEVAEEWL